MLFKLIASFLAFNALAQNPSPTSGSNSTKNATVITTTITSLLTPTSSGGSSIATSLILTLTLNSTFTSPPASNSSLNGTLTTNGTSINGTANVTEWKEGDDWIPFEIPLDPAYGVAGALLALSGIPVAILGGKNSWSSLAIASGYSLTIFTLVMIFRFGVQQAIQPPSPHPPSSLLRGMYLLACIFACVIGSAIGIFLWKMAKYWVSAAGGFAFGWFILALKQGGTIQSILGRWGLLGGLTVGGLIASLPEKLNPWFMLLGTAWIGATAFVLGVDCYTRAGLKEFYIYNLGFWELYPSLKGSKYPLTQTMAIELGILGAIVLVSRFTFSFCL